MSEQNKAAAVAFYRKALIDRDVQAAFRLYAGPYYRQHNPLIEDGEEGLHKFAAWIDENNRDARANIKRVFADGDFVIMHVHWTGVFGPQGGAVVDVFRFEGGKIVEHWDVIQQIPETAANGNTMF